MPQAPIDPPSTATAPDADGAFDHPRHFTDLDGLRGALALSVVFFHYGINALVRRASHGHVPGLLFQLSVDFFFLLSGYVLAYAMRDGVPDLRGFAIKRVFRLLPIHYICLFAMLILIALATTPILYVAAHPAPIRIVGDLFAIAPLLHRDPLDGPAWSVTWELVLPIVAVALARYARLPARWFGPVLLVVLLAGLSWTSWSIAAGGRATFLRALCGLLGGMCLYRTMAPRRVPAWLQRPAAVYALGGAIVMIMLAARLAPFSALLFPWCAAAAIVAGTTTHSLLSSRPFAWLGRISYTLYLVHVPVLATALLLSGAKGDGGMVVKLAALAASLLAATLLSHHVERPAMRAGRHLASRWP